MKISIIKIGGNVIDYPEKLDEFLSIFAKVPGFKILVHGGGVMATRFGESMGDYARNGGRSPYYGQGYT